MLWVEGIGVEERLREQIFEFVSRFERDALQGGPDEKDLALVKAVRIYLDFLRDVSQADPRIVDPETAQAAGVEFRQNLLSLLEQTNLPTKLKSEIQLAADEQPKVVESLKGFKFSKWVGFSHGATWTTQLRRFIGQPNLRFLEVGSFEGRSTCWLLKNILLDSSCELVCVDMFDSTYESAFDHNIAQMNSKARVVKKKGMSHEILKDLSSNYFDCIYLDAASTASGELLDCSLSWPLLKRGGLLILDDYGGGATWELGVTKAVDAFLDCMRDQLEVLHKGFQVFLAKKV